MALTFPDYFPESFLARVVAADAAAEFEYRGEMSSAQCDVQRAITRYVHTVALACAQATCEAVRAGERPVAELAGTVEEFWRRLRVYVDLELCPDWSSRSLVEAAFAGLKQSPEWVQHLGERRALAEGQGASGSEDAVVNRVPAQPDELPEDATREQKAQAVKAFLTKAEAATGERFFKRDIWRAANYKSSTEFERWQRNDRRATKAADRNFRGVLREKRYRKNRPQS